MPTRSDIAMRDAWDGFAREDAAYYIACIHDRGELFYASAQGVVRKALDWAASHGANLSRDGVMLDIGCGMGRLCKTLRESCDHVVGVDVSPEMIRLARDAHPEMTFFCTCGSDLAPVASRSIDFALSFVVFQHVPEWEAVRGTLRDLRRVLKASGLAALQFDTRPLGPLGLAYKMLPDFLLPRHHRRFIRRYRRTPEALQRALADARLEVIDERGLGTDRHWVLVRPSPYTDGAGERSG